MESYIDGPLSRHEGSNLLFTQGFCLLLGRAQHAPLIRRELTEAFVPEGYSPDEVWDALTVIRRSQAIVSPDVIRPGEGSPAVTCWYTVPESLQDSLRRISELTRKGSMLDEIVDERSGKRFITQQYIEEMLTNLRLDGFPATYEETREALIGDVVPTSDTQRLACNFHRIMCEMGDLEGIHLDAGLLEELYRRLTKGVDTFPPLSDQHSPLEPLYRLHRDEVSGADPVMLSKVADVANDLVCDQTEDPILVSLLVNCQFWHDAVFPRCNNLMGCIASRLYLYRHGFPVFRYVPKIHLLWSWRNGLFDDVCDYSLDESHESNGLFGIDWTAYYDTLMKLMLAHVVEMERTLCTRKAADDTVMSDVEASALLNIRQIAVIRQSILDPGREFRISWHRQQYGVVYSTARADLQGLVDLGLFTCSKSGSAFVFRPVPGLASKIERSNIVRGTHGIR